MSLKFLEKDNRVSYIADAWEERQKLRPVCDELYKTRKRPGVLVIDIQNAFTSPDSPLGPQTQEVREIVDRHVLNSKRIIDSAREKGFPIFYAYVSYREDGTDGGIFTARNPSLAQVCREGSKMTEIDERIRPEKGDYLIVKKESSFFAGTPLGKILTYLKVDVNIIVGNSASGCVRATVLDSLAHGFPVVVPEECIADRAIGPLKANLFDMMIKYAAVISVEDALNWISTLPPITENL